MVGKKTGKALEREGLVRTDNGMKQSSWPDVPMINQKNYYTEYMKRDDQILPLRLQNEANREKMIQTAKDRDRALARTGNTDVPMVDASELGEDELDSAANDGFDPSKVIVIHPGSQNLRIGFANDALPRTIPMVVARKVNGPTESENSEPLPKRQKLGSGEEIAPEQLFEEEWAKKYQKQTNELKIDMRYNKRKVLPNSKELVVNFNRRTSAETISEHNDPIRIEWTSITGEDGASAPDAVTGHAALRIPDDSNPKYRLYWPIQNGWLNEEPYESVQHLKEDIDTIFWRAIRDELDVSRLSDLGQYSVVFVIPDIYDKNYVHYILDLFMRDFGVKGVCFIQESIAASFGAGYTNACIVDIGAQKTSIGCVEDGMVIEDSRINLKYGGYDVTDTFIKMMLFDHFPYADINLRRRYDFLLAEELKIKYCTMNQANISVQLYDFHVRAPNQPTRKYQFKTYDEVILAPMGFCDPSTFDNSRKLDGRRKLIDCSYNIYDPDMPDDPVPTAQLEILNSIKPTSNLTNGYSSYSAANANGNGEISTPHKERPQSLLRYDTNNENTPIGSQQGSPAPEANSTPIPAPMFHFSANGSPGPNGMGGMPNLNLSGGHPVPLTGLYVDAHIRTARTAAAERDSILPIAPLDTAIITSIMHAARGDEKKMKDLAGAIMVIGGGAKTPGFGFWLEDNLRKKMPNLREKVLVGTSPRDMDGQVVVWKGGAVFGQLTTTNDSWVGRMEWERLGFRVLHQKVMWNW